MKFDRRRLLHLMARAVVFAVASLVPFTEARSQASRSISIVVPFAAGGPQDTVTRLVAEQVSKSRGQTLLIENRPGASTTIGTEAVARAVADGNTLLVGGAAFLQTPYLRKVNYDPLTNFEPICNLARFPSILLVSDAAPYRTFSDFLAAARSKPGELTLASFGPLTAEQIAVELLKRRANVNMTFVPYPGYAPAVSGLLGGHITSVIADYSASAQHLAAGKIRALATLSPTRIQPLPEIPTMAELGYPGIELDLWSGLFTPANTPKEVVSKLTDWFSTAVQTSELRTRLVDQGFYPVGVCGAEFKALTKKQYEDYGRVIREIDFKPE
jgi:tripartite-type tricarboxylate transporter receptor subunit TctC